MSQLLIVHFRQVSELEKKLDNLVSLLNLPNRVSGADREEDESPIPTLTEGSENNASLSSFKKVQNDVVPPPMGNPTVTPSVPTSFSPSGSSNSPGYDFDMSGGVWDVLLLIFR